ncbi:MAG TPA: CoA-binding protein [Syntrophobacteraceae bacterium]|nr:CoA-binding protein [Syntrophobacteraceae bacterium]
MMNAKLKYLFCPESVAVVGASNGFDKLGYHVMKSLVEGGYGGRIFPVNPKGGQIWGRQSYQALSAIPEAVDLAAITVPGPFVPEIVHQCGRKMVKGAVLITAGFREIEDPKGAALQEEVRKIARLYELPIVGPNTFGFVNRTFGVNASFTPEFSRLEKGGVALISQSGGFCHLCGFMAMEQRMGVSKLMSLGNHVNVGFPEMLRHLVEEDDDTRVIALYIEGLDHPRDLLDTAKSLKGKKPIIAYKAGRNERGDSASRFHTGVMAGDYQIWKGALRQAGILEVSSPEEFIDTAKVLDKCPPIKGPRIAVLSGQAGPGLIAADAVENAGLQFARFSARTQETINRLLSPMAMRTNPVDMGPAWYSPEDMLDILKAVVEDEGTDGVIFLNVFASANVHMAKAMAERMKGAAPFTKPVVVVFSAPRGIWDAEIVEIDGKKGISIVPTPDRAGVVMGNLWKENLLPG